MCLMLRKKITQSPWLNISASSVSTKEGKYSQFELRKFHQILPIINFYNSQLYFVNFSEIVQLIYCTNSLLASPRTYEKGFQKPYNFHLIKFHRTKCFWPSLSFIGMLMVLGKEFIQGQIHCALYIMYSMVLR